MMSTLNHIDQTEDDQGESWNYRLWYNLKIFFKSNLS